MSPRARNTPKVNSKSVCCHSNCMFCPTGERRCVLVDEGRYQAQCTSTVVMISKTVYVLKAHNTPKVNSKSACCHSNCMFCPTVLWQRLIMDLGLKGTFKPLLLFFSVCMY